MRITKGNCLMYRKQRISESEWEMPFSLEEACIMFYTMTNSLRNSCKMLFFSATESTIEMSVRKKVDTMNGKITACFSTYQEHTVKIECKLQLYYLKR